MKAVNAAYERMDGVVIEIIGSFVWLSGNTKAHKDGIKAMGFRWSHDKAMWYKAPDGYKRRGGGKIRSMYGSDGQYTGKIGAA